VAMLPPLSRLMLVDGAYGEQLAASEAPRITTTLLVRVGAVIALIGEHSSVSLKDAHPALHRSNRAMWDRRRVAPGTITRIGGAWPASAQRSFAEGASPNWNRDHRGCGN
jgi:hypothetical protein